METWGHLQAYRSAEEFSGLAKVVQVPANFLKEVKNAEIVCVGFGKSCIKTRTLDHKVSGRMNNQHLY